MQKPYQGLRTFLKTPVHDINQALPSHVKFGVLGIPFDGATSNRPGARFGPSAIREASIMLTDGIHPELETDPRSATVDLGDVPVSNSNVGKSLDEIQAAVEQFLLLNHLAEQPNNKVVKILGKDADHKQLVTLGGDHTITLGILRAMKKKYGKLAVIHFDAHCDTWEDHFGDPLGHGTWVRNAIEEELVDPVKFWSIGIRSPTDMTAKHYLSNAGGTTYTAREIMGMDDHSLKNTFYWNMIREIGSTPCYLSFDIDALDPSMAPGTGTPEIGGLSTLLINKIMEYWIPIPFVGMDVVEVAPSYDHAQLTSIAAANIAFTYMAAFMKRYS